MSALHEFDFESNGLAIAWLNNRARDLQMGRAADINDDDLLAVGRLLSIVAAEAGGRPEEYEISDGYKDEPPLIDQIRTRIAEKVREKRSRFFVPSNIIAFPVHRTRPSRAAWQRNHNENRRFP